LGLLEECQEQGVIVLPQPQVQYALKELKKHRWVELRELVLEKKRGNQF